MNIPLFLSTSVELPYDFDIQTWAQVASMQLFDEVDEGTAIFKVTSSPPVEAHFVGYDGMPSDWYLRILHEGIRMIRGAQPITSEIPTKAL